VGENPFEFVILGFAPQAVTRHRSAIKKYRNFKTHASGYNSWSLMITVNSGFKRIVGRRRYFALLEKAKEQLKNQGV
jgi:hypothetical protein